MQPSLNHGINFCSIGQSNDANYLRRKLRNSMTGTSPNRPTQQDHSEYISSLNNTPRILRFQARLADAATNLRYLSQPEDDMYLEPSSPHSASSESTLDRMDHLIDDSTSDNPFFTSPSAKQAAIKRRRSIKSAKAIEIEMDPEDSPMRNRSVSRSRRSSTVSSVTSYDDTPSVYPIGSFGEKLASAANDNSAQKRTQRTVSGFGSVSRAKRRKLKVRNVVDPKLWTHSQDSTEASVRAEIDEDDSPTFVMKKQTDGDNPRRRIRGNKRDSMRVIMGTPVPHHSHIKHRHSRPQDSLDVKLNRLRQTTSATELDLSSHNIVPDSLEEVLQSESFIIRASSQKSIDSIDGGDLSSLSQSLPLSYPDTSLTTPESTLEDETKLEIDTGVGKDSPSQNSDLDVAESTPLKGSELHIDTSVSPSVQLIQASPIVDEHSSELQENPSPSTSYIHQSPLTPDTSNAVESDDTLPYEEASTSVDDKPAVASTSVGSTGGNLDKGTEIYPESDDESASSELHGASAKKPSSSYLSQLASSMSRFILG
ncbi:hypothetical protein K450DRAFT_216996 [Umbelopsis ramanniana AG]|uniref:Uncharacterized protein n=1 Tax=Umbelopsis ramanniana AG TaxID=1314678 RepID=A0AAD5HJB5_UMBRA|nr:uncharacterized protein K450DRAFT_216996 [Umbelopsis ramanniana AG]KAI8584581.1 hypothetical protein K450DRAFT_216996 [Umbelopsis ramanniana AG]